MSQEFFDNFFFFLLVKTYKLRKYIYSEPKKAFAVLNILRKERKVSFFRLDFFLLCWPPANRLYVCRVDDDCNSDEICQGVTCVLGCRSSSTCPASQACINNECTDPCSSSISSCGTNAVCTVQNHQALCSCPAGLTGDSTIACTRLVSLSLSLSLCVFVRISVCIWQTIFKVSLSLSNTHSLVLSLSYLRFWNKIIFQAREGVSWESGLWSQRQLCGRPLCGQLCRR